MYVANQWQLVGIVKNDTQVAYYINGVLADYDNLTISSVVYSGSNTWHYIGKRNVVGGGAGSDLPNEYFNGSIDEVLIFNRSLSVAEIGALYNASANKYYNNFTSLGEGNHTFTAYAIDVAGNKNSTGQYRVIVDTTSANATLTSPSNGVYSSNSSLNFTANLSDNLGVKNATLYIYNATGGLVNMTAIVNFAEGVVNTIVGVVVYLADGIYTWFYEVFDWAGNRFATGNQTITIDSTKPLINFTSPTPGNNSGVSGSFVINASIFEVNLANVSWNWNGTITIFNSSSQNITSLGNGSWIFYISQGDLTVGASYVYNLTVVDLAGNVNVTETRTIVGNSVPSFASVSYGPTANADLDPNVNVSISVNISDIDNNFNSAMIQWHNQTSGYGGNNVSMGNISVIGINTLLNGTLTLPAYENNITFRIFANDTTGDSNYTSNYTLRSFWDCGWISDNDLSGSGWDENRWVTNLSLNNTGDASYATNNCSLDFRLTYDLAEGRIYFDNVKYKPSSIYTLAAKANTTIKINATFGTEVKLENTIITINEVSTRSANSTANSSLALVSNQNGPYLYQKISSYPTIVYLNTSGNFSLQGYLRNLMGSATINENNTAYNVSFYWGLPSGLTNSSGNLTMNYTNLTDNSLYYNDIYAEFSNLATMSAGIRNITLNAYGYNLTGSLIKDSNNLTLLTESVSINFLCYNISDGVYVSPCGALDGDYVAPVASSGSSGGGAGGGGGAGKESKSEKSFATFELVRGKDNSFSFEIRNKYELPMEKIKIKVSGIKAEYISVEPNEIALLEPKSALNISVKISSPAYFTQGSYTLDFEIKGELVSNESRIGVTEMKKATLIILEMNRENASALFDSMKEMVAKMNESGMNLEQVNKIMVGANGNYDKLKFLELKGEYESAKKIYENAFEAKKIIDELKAGIADAEKQGISALETKKLMYLAEAIFVRGDYALALERLKEAKLTYALEVKGEFSLLYAIKNNPGESVGVALATVLLSLGSGFLVRLKLYKNKLRALQEEEKLLLELMKVVQRECFEKNRMSMEEYGEAMSQYEIKLSKTIEEKIRIETKITNLLKLRGKKKALYEEKERLIALMKKVQDEYLNKGKIESRIYDNMIKSYSTRLSEIEEAITFFDAEEALQSDKLFYRFLRAVRLRKGAGR